ncbi:putative non-specific serine/threonine protein kinase [Seiridium cardinale]|uniref:non-specific serine/threonine protein kinase n=1 Tax=Seiridium cardinale TaxID=138064 RepID=A0ABR2XGI5_9PEZI
MSTSATSDYHHPHHSASHSQNTHGQPSRSHSTRSRPTSSTAGAPHRSASHHHSHTRQSSTSARPVQDVLPQRDYETSNVNSKRSLSRDRHAPPTSRGAGADPKGLHRRTSNRAANNPPGEMAGPTAVANNAASAAIPPVMQAAADARATGAKTRTTRTSIPTQSGKWILGKTIGAGSMGKVKLAKKEDGTEQVACKIIPRGSTDENHHSRADKERADQSKEIRTAREAAIVTLLDHPNVCGLRDVVRTNHHWYMLFEYVNGGQMLDYIISHGKLKDKQARKFSRQIASALDYCHRNSIVHRDLKIENILIAKTGDIKIIDFGLSNLFAPRGHLKTFCGSLYFAAPELLQARAYTGPEVDVWSFGIVLYVLVCGKVPFDDQSMPALHAKIKKGVVDYPSWLSTECRHLLSRMLVVEPKSRATMHEVLNHPWMTKGYGGPPENHLPVREPLTLPLDQEVINAMTGFNFGPPEVIKAQLTRLIESDEYKRAITLWQKEKDIPVPSRDVEKKRGFGFDFYKRRNSNSSRDNLTAPSSEALALGNDPLNAFSPLISIYYLVKEKQDRDTVDIQPKHHAPKNAADSPMPEIIPPQAAHTNTATYEMPGEKPTGGRSRPRARTHGEDDAPEEVKKTQLSPPLPKAPEGQLEVPHKKESTAVGILRRFSTRRRRDPERPEKDRSHPPVVQVHSPENSIAPRKSFSIRRSRRDRDENEAPRLRSGSSQPQHRDLLSPPLGAGDSTSSKKGLGRSTSVNSADLRRRRFDSANRSNKEPPPTSGSDQSGTEKSGTEQKSSTSARSASMRAKSLGHARRESIQARRLKRGARAADVPEETDAEVGEASGASAERLDDSELAKPVFLKGLFSVSTTSTKSVPQIRSDVKRVLKQLGVEYIEIRGGFSCHHRPSIDLNKVADIPGSPAATPGHRRRFSFGIRNERDRDELREMDRGPATPRTPGKGHTDRSDSNSELSENDSLREAGGSSRRVPGETTTQVQSDLGGSMTLDFEIFIVKVPLLSLHGLQFKRIEGNTWQFKNMADQILKELRL